MYFLLVFQKSAIIISRGIAYGSFSGDHTLICIPSESSKINIKELQIVDKNHNKPEH
jgi:hypothetical protein